MDIALFAGLQTAKITDVIKNRVSFNIYTNTNLEDGLAEVVVNTTVDKIIMFDSALIKNDRVMDCVEVFTALHKLAKQDEEREIVLISKTKVFIEAFEQMMYDCRNARKVEVTNLTSRVIISAILGQGLDKEVKPVPVQQSIEKEIEVESLPVEEPEPVGEDTGLFIKGTGEDEIEEEPEPMQEQPKKKRGIKLRRESLEGSFYGNKLIIVTGNPNSGATNLCCELVNTLSNNGVDTMLVDMDVYSKGVNMYFNDLDNDNSDGHTKAGLTNSLRDLTSIDESIQEVSGMLDLLGTSSIHHVSTFDNTNLDSELVFDVISTFTTDYRATVIHLLPEQLLLYRDLIKVADRVVYATNCTLNGLNTVDRILSPNSYKDQADKRYLTLLHRKLRYTLTNYGLSKRITESNFLDCLADLTGVPTMIQSVVGTVKHQKDFDDFTDTKKLYSEKSEKGNFYNMIVEIMK